jgi:hypothetical protein
MDLVIETFNKRFSVRAQSVTCVPFKLIMLCSPLPKGEDSSYAAALRNIDFFAPKFLTSSKLLGLQLKDVSMRRQLLLQMIVLLGHLKDGKSFSPELPPFKMDKVKALQEKAYAALATVPPAGPKFVTRVKLLLQVLPRLSAVFLSLTTIVFSATSIGWSGSGWAVPALSCRRWHVAP